MIRGVICAARYHSALVPGSFPVYLESSQTPIGSRVTKRNVVMPASVATGDLLIMHFTNGENRTVTTPSGWTRLGAQATSSVSVRSDLFYRYADGSEGGTTVPVSASGSCRGVANVFRIQAGTFSIEATISVAQSSGDGVATLPALAPGSGRDHLWIALATLYFDASISAYPLPDNQQVHDMDAAVSANISRAAACTLGIAAGGEASGAFSIASVISPPPWIVSVIAVPSA